jgi:hypothetical protein
MTFISGLFRKTDLTQSDNYRFVSPYFLDIT